MDGQRILEELPAGNGLFFAGGLYGPDACIRRSASGTCSSPFLTESFSRVFGAGLVKGTFRIFNVIIV
jgi:hypothetical protein